MEPPQIQPAGMLGIYLEDEAWMASPERQESVFRPHKPLPRKRDIISAPTDLRTQYHSATNRASHSQSPVEQSSSSMLKSSTTPVLPPTPPAGNNEIGDFSHDESSVADTTILRSGVVTPVHRKSPPTPDQTPPRHVRELTLRPWLATQPSMASTRAESFATAREEFQSDSGSEVSWGRRHERSYHDLPATQNFQSQPSFLAVVAVNKVENGRDVVDKRQTLNEERNGEEPVTIVESPTLPGEFDGMDEQERLSDDELLETEIRNNAEHASTTVKLPATTFNRSGKSVEPCSSIRLRLPRRISKDLDPDTNYHNETLLRGSDIRDRVQEAINIRASDFTEQFANGICWSSINEESDRGNLRKSWRSSGVSTNSTVEAMLYETEPKRTPTLRHRVKNTSLRAASSPLPNSNRNSLQSNESAPRLSHKKGRLSNQNRLSYGSDASRSLSISSAFATPSKAEVIRVAVIPERRSSLQSSPNSYKRHSKSISNSSSGHSRFPSMHKPALHRHRDSSDTSSIMTCKTCGKSRHYPPTIPPRGSSFSAPTSRNPSRSNSITSEHLHVHRMAAEHDLRRTLDRMESERIGPILVKAFTAHGATALTPPPPEPGTEKWASLRPTSILNTPFSQPSVKSASAGSVEMGEARAVNLFPHNNDSLQLIEKHTLPESRAVQELRNGSLAQGFGVSFDEGSTPRSSACIPSVDSPLRNPREPPEPPGFQIISPTPTVMAPFKGGNAAASSGQIIKRNSTLKRPALNGQRYSASFMKSMTRNLSLKNARNKRADEDLDGNLHPFWRPRGFWDDMNDSDDDYSEEGEVRNSLGMPQKRTVINGPISLVRHISDSTRARRQSRGVVKQNSFSSLSRLRASRKLYKVPGMRGVHFQFIGLKGLQQRVFLATGRKEDEELEKRRRELRKSIGASVISQGDSRFPTTMRLPASTVNAHADAVRA